VPDMKSLERIPVKFKTSHTPPAGVDAAEGGFQPYARDEKLARPWALPGTPGLEHRIGGLEKQHLTGNISYDAQNHEYMSKLRHARVQAIADGLPATEVFGDSSGELLVIGWGDTTGAIRAGVENMRAAGHSIGHVQLRWLNPFPNDLGDILKRYKRVLVPELNLGQLVKLLRARYLVDVRSYPKIQGQPFKESEIISAIKQQLESN
jgi:2-oxoglutarate/2-oxoacid ferredoxin oxidoreductase subunit alpha